MKKLFTLFLTLIFVALLLFSLASCGECAHEWKAATCATPKTCTKCGVTEGEALGHSWSAATCTAPKTCTICGATEGNALGHSWISATCTTPKTCAVCGVTEGNALGHSWKAATCTSLKICTRCHRTTGSILGHSWKAATCTSPKTCTVCGTTEGNALGHSFDQWIVDYPATETTTGERHRKCTKCGVKVTEEIPKLHAHVFDQITVSQEYLCNAATCTKKATYYYSCKCGQKGTLTFEYGDFLPHVFDQKKETKEYLYAEATDTKNAEYYYSCICGKKGTRIFEHEDVFTININIDGGNSSSNITSKKIKNRLTPEDLFYDVTKDNCRFIGWSLNGELIFSAKGTQIRQYNTYDGMTLVATYRDTCQLVITAIGDGIGTVLGGGEYYYYQSVVLYAEPQDGYKFDGWFLNGKIISSARKYSYQMEKADTTIEARFSVNSYAVRTASNSPDNGIVAINPPDANSSKYEVGSSKYYELYYFPKTHFSFKFGESVTVAAYTKTTKQFLGWCDSQGNIVSTNPVYTFTMESHNYSLVAKWDENAPVTDFGYYFIEYDLDGGVNYYNNPTSAPTGTYTSNFYAPEKIGYEFIGWDTAIISKDTKLKAKWKLANKNISYDLDGGTNNSGNPSNFTITDGKITLKEPVKKGYRFVGWTSVDNPIPQKAITIDLKDAENFKDYKFTANWQSAIYSISYDTAGGINSPKNNVKKYKISDGEIRLYAPTKEYYRFIGWKINGVLVTKIDPELWAADITLVAVWEPLDYSIRYDLNGGSAENKSSYTVETPEFTLKSPTKKGYRFIGWVGSNGDVPELTVTIVKGSHENLSYTANWEMITYSITYILNGGTNNSNNNKESYTVKDSKITLYAPSRDYYAFSRWTIDGKTVTEIDTSVAEDVTVIAVWTPITYSIGCDLNGGNGTNKSSYTIETPKFTLNPPTKKGYRFIGWTGSNGDVPELTVTVEKGSHGDLSYTANWEIIYYTITIRLNGATSEYEYPSSYTIEDEVLLPVPTRTGYTLSSKWTEKIEKGSTGDRSLDCVWTANHYTITWDESDGIRAYTYTISFDLNGATGTVPAAQVVNRTTGLNYPSIPTRDGYLFAGWYTVPSCTGDPYDFAADVTEDITLYAKWINYSGYGTLSVGGSSGNITFTARQPSQYRYYAFVPLVSEDITIYSISSSDTYGYLFNSSKSQLAFDDDSGSGQNFRITYKVTAGQLYYVVACAYSNSSSCSGTISINGTSTPMAGGTTNGTVSVAFDSPFTLPAGLTRDGYTFAGWYDGVGGTGTQYTDAEGNSVRNWDKAEDAMLYPKWVPNPYTISFVSNGGSDVDSITQGCGSEVAAPEKPTFPGKSFVGWFTDSALTNEYHFTVMPAENITLYAKWIDYDVILDCVERGEIRVNDSISAETFFATATDTDGNPVEVIAQLIGGTKIAGNSITVRLIATGKYDIYTVKTISGIKVYGAPSLIYNSDKKDVNLSDSLDAALFGASAEDTYHETLTVSVVVKEGACQGGNIVTIILSTTDKAGNTTSAELANVKVYDVPDITGNIENAEMKDTDVLTDALFGISAKDSFGEALTVDMVIEDGVFAAGNTLAVRCSASDSKGNHNSVIFTVKIYGTPSISDASNTAFSDKDDISASSLGIIAKDSFGNPLSDVTLELIDGEHIAGATLTYRITVTDRLGNINTKVISDIRIYGTPTISYDAEKVRMSVTDEINELLFSATAKDSHGGVLPVHVTLNSGSLAGGNTVTFLLFATDALGNTCEIVTREIKVYSADDIRLIYDTLSGNINIIKKSSRGEEFSARAFNSFGDECEIHLEAAEGYTLAGGNMINLYIVAADILGNEVRSELISGIKVYDMPVLTYGRAYNYIRRNESPYELFALADSFGKEMLFNVEIISGSLESSETIVYRITAQDKAKNIFSQDYTLYVLSEGESVLELYRNGEKVGEQRVYKNQGYSLPYYPGYAVEWFLEDTALTDQNAVSLSPWAEDSGIFKVYTIPRLLVYSITYELNGGINDDTNPFSYTTEDEIILKNPTRMNYVFAGWKEGDSIPLGSIGNKTFTATWTPVKYDITYVLNGGTNDKANPSGYTIEDEVTLKEPSRVGYAFAGWKEGNTIEIGSTGAKTFTATWTPVRYDITYVLNGGTNDKANPSGYTVEDEVTLKDPTRSNYIFSGWKEGDSIPLGSTGNKTFTATWTPVRYDITYVLNGGTNDKANPSGYTIEDKVTLKNPTRAGYVFAGWKEGNTIEVGSTGAKTFTAAWTPVRYDISYMLNGGTNDKANPSGYTIEDEVTLNDPTRVGYVFAGWKEGDSIALGSIGAKTFTATWTPVRYDIAYVLNGGTNDKANPSGYTIEDEVTLKDPTRVGYVFAGWKEGDSIALGSIGAKTFTAAWTPVKYDITYVLNGGTNDKANPSGYTIEDMVTLKNPTRAGYAFAGWKEGNTIEVSSTGAKTFTATWTPVRYNIAYVLNGGTNNKANPSGYTIEDEVTLKEPSRVGYVFTGWKEGNSIVLGSTGDKTFSATWKIITYKIIYELNGGQNSANNPSTFICSDTVVLDAATREGYNFLGWFMGDSQTTTIDGSIAKDVVLIAKWEFSLLISGNTVTGITDYGKTLTTLTIPQTYNGETITAIGANAFENCINLTNIAFSDSITSIGNYAFQGCTMLTSITIPNGVTRIGHQVFYGCRELANITIPSSVTSIGWSAFYGCSKLANITIPNSITSIGYQAFYGCTGLTSITIPDSVISIGQSAFSYCTRLASIQISNNITRISSQTFYGCTGLTGITIPDSVTSIDHEAFHGCTGLTSIMIPNSVTSIGSGSFESCIELASITISGSVASIGRSAFYNTAHYNDSSYWENEVLYIGDYLIKAENTISGAYTIKFGTQCIAEEAFFGCTSLTRITIPNSVTSIGSDAFSGCSGLASITIPDSVTNIGQYAFFGCKELKGIYYTGSESEWNTISKGLYWNYNTGSYTIHYNYKAEE